MDINIFFVEYTILWTLRLHFGRFIWDVRAKLFRTLQFQLARDWRLIISCLKFNLEDYMVYSCQDNLKTSNFKPTRSENGPSAISPSNSFIFRTTFGFRHIKMTLNS